MGVASFGCRRGHPHATLELAARCDASHVGRATVREPLKRDRKRRVQRKLDPVRSFGEGSVLWLAGVTIPPINEWKAWHWTRYRSEKERWHAYVALYARRMTLWPVSARVRVEVLVRFPDAARHDPDGVAPKFIMDGLVLAGILPDDDCRTVAGGVLTRCEVCVPEAEVGTRVEILPA